SREPRPGTRSTARATADWWVSAWGEPYPVFLLFLAWLSLRLPECRSDPIDDRIHERVIAVDPALSANPAGDCDDLAAALPRQQIGEAPGPVALGDDDFYPIPLHLLRHLGDMAGRGSDARLRLDIGKL